MRLWLGAAGIGRRLARGAEQRLERQLAGGGMEGAKPGERSIAFAKKPLSPVCSLTGASAVVGAGDGLLKNAGCGRVGAQKLGKIADLAFAGDARGDAAGAFD